MPHYFFDTDDGTEQFRDDDGLELADDQAARDEGSRALAELASEYIVGGAPQKNLVMRVRNTSGTALLEISINFSIKPLV